VDVLEPELADPVRLGSWLAAAVHAGPPDGSPVDLGGLHRVPLLAAGLLAARTVPTLEVDRAAV